jgi:hypothetical protein
VTVLEEEEEEVHREIAATITFQLEEKKRI